MAAALIGSVHYHGQGVAVDYKRALAAYKIAAEGGNAVCQSQLAYMLSEEGYGCDVDYKQAQVWYEKAAAQDYPFAVVTLGCMVAYHLQPPQQPSWRRGRELLQRAIELGRVEAIQILQGLNACIQLVTPSHAGNYSGT